MLVKGFRLKSCYEWAETAVGIRLLIVRRLLDRGVHVVPEANAR